MSGSPVVGAAAACGRRPLPLPCSALLGYVLTKELALGLLASGCDGSGGGEIWDAGAAALVMRAAVLVGGARGFGADRQTWPCGRRGGRCSTIVRGLGGGETGRGLIHIWLGPDRRRQRLWMSSPFLKASSWLLSSFGSLRVKTMILWIERRRRSGAVTFLKASFWSPRLIGRSFFGSCSCHHCILPCVCVVGWS